MNVKMITQNNERTRKQQNVHIYNSVPTDLNYPFNNQYTFMILHLSKQFIHLSEYEVKFIGDFKCIMISKYISNLKTVTLIKKIQLNQTHKKNVLIKTNILQAGVYMTVLTMKIMTLKSFSSIKGDFYILVPYFALQILKQFHKTMNFFFSLCLNKQKRYHYSMIYR